MNYLVSAQVGAMLTSLFVCSLLAKWYFVPWSRRVTRRVALLGLLWLHVPCYVTLILFSAQQEGYPISNRATLEAVVGDVWVYGRGRPAEKERKSMKALRITYCVSTCLFAGIFLTTGTMYLAHNATMVAKFEELGYPLYVLNILGTAKVAGAIALLAPKYPRIKEWAYAGFVFDLFGAAWSHAAVQGPGEAVRLLIPIAVAFIS
jgi:hypothetical protein